MPSMTRMIFIALHAAAVITLTYTTLPTMAAPLPLPTAVYLRLVSPPRDVSWSSQSMRVARNVTSSFVPTNPHLAFSRASSSEVEPDKSVEASIENSTADPQIQLLKLHQATKQDSKNLKQLAESASSKTNDVTFQRKCIAQLNAFHSNILRQQSALSAIVNEKHKVINGRSDHNSDHALEELLKGVIMACKDGMKYSEELVKNVPILGPYLAPIAYDMKCLVDTVLNYSRDVLVDILRDLPPGIANLLGA